VIIDSLQPKFNTQLKLGENIFIDDWKDDWMFQPPESEVDAETMAKYILWISRQGTYTPEDIKAGRIFENRLIRDMTKQNIKLLKSVKVIMIVGEAFLCAGALLGQSELGLLSLAPSLLHCFWCSCR